MNQIMVKKRQNQLPSTSQSSSSSCKNDPERLQTMKLHTKLVDMILEERGYEVGQRNGQRISILTDHQLPDDGICREVFVGKLPRDMLELELLRAMEKIGKVYKIRLMMDFSGFNRGYGFVVFVNPADAVRACKELNNTFLRPGSENRIGVCPSFDNKNLKIGNLPIRVPKDKVVSELAKVVDGIESVTWPECPLDRGTRFALVKFRTHEDATKARRVLCPGTARILNNKIQVDWARPDKPIMCPTVDDTQPLIPITETSININQNQTNDDIFASNGLLNFDFNINNDQSNDINKNNYNNNFGSSNNLVNTSILENNRVKYNFDPMALAQLTSQLMYCLKVNGHFF